MEEWITVKDAAQIRNCSERNIIRLIQAGEVKAKKDGKKWLVLIDTSKIYSASSPQLSEVISALKVQLQEKDSQISKLQDQLGNMRNDMEEMRKDSADASQRHDTIVLQLTRQLEQSQRMLEAHREPWYRRMFGKGRRSGGEKQ
ncbi:MAG: hypothetical protein QG670_2672 [Thermoproteota archaeon]|nr:hypothetical protein [Thermoproteota archaeon]